MFEYKLVNVTSAKPYTIDGTANSWAEQGWRTVAVIPSQGPGYAASILIEREIKGREEPLPAHLRDDAPYLICSECGRKSWGGNQPGDRCGMTQPDSSRCDGHFQTVP